MFTNASVGVKAVGGVMLIIGVLFGLAAALDLVILMRVYKYKPNLKLEDDETLELFRADDGSAESGDEAGTANGACAMDDDTVFPGNGRGSMLKWSRESVLVLIDCYKSNASKFDSPKHKKKHVRQEIADVISEEAGQIFSWSQVEEKWKNLTEKYRDVIENSSSGNSRKTCSFFDELQELYGGKVNLKKQVVGDTFAAEDGSTESGDENLATNGRVTPADVTTSYSMHSVGYSGRSKGSSGQQE